jgi:hypothetical protein
MPKPSVRNVEPTRVILERDVELMIHGNNFAGDAGHHCAVKLESRSGHTWDTPEHRGNPWHTGTVVDPNTIRVHSTPHQPHHHRYGTGLGDLTTTVTNGDGTGTSVAQPQDEEYV